MFTRSSLFFLLGTICLIFNGFSQQFPKKGTVQVRNYLNVRSGPSTDDKAIGRLLPGDQVVVLGQQGKFYKLQYPKKLGAYIANWLLLKVDDSHTVTGDNVNVRSGPGRQHLAICTLNKGDKVTVHSVDAQKWAKITPPNKAEAWVSSRYIVLGESPVVAAKREKEMEKAQQLYNDADANFSKFARENAMTDQQYQTLLQAYQMVIKNAPNTALATQAQDGIRKTENLKVQIDASNRVRALNDQLKAEVAKVREEERQKFEEKQKELESETKIFKYQGWLESVGGIAWKPATHRLREGGLTLFFLKLPKGSNLDLDQFEGKRVGINGTVKRFRLTYRIIVVDEIEVLYEDPSNPFIPQQQ